MGDVTDKVKFENWLLYGLTRPESWLTHVKALHLDYRKANAELAKLATEGIACQHRLCLEVEKLRHTEAELARVTAEAAALRKVIFAPHQYSERGEHLESCHLCEIVADPKSAGAGLLKRLEASEAVAKAAKAFSSDRTGHFASEQDALDAALEAWKRARGET